MYDGGRFRNFVFFLTVATVATGCTARPCARDAMPLVDGGNSNELCGAAATLDAAAAQSRHSVSMAAVSLVMVMETASTPPNPMEHFALPFLHATRSSS